MNSRLKRLTTEFNNFKKEETPNISAGLVNSDITHWTAVIIGPIGTPYENGILNLNIEFPEDYPFKPPHIKFTSKIWHPNVSTSGGICLDILKNNWSPALTVSKILLSICSLLADPNDSDPLNSEAAQQHRTNIEEYNNTVRKYLNKNDK